MPPEIIQQSQLLSRKSMAIGAALLVLAGAGLFGFMHIGGAPPRNSDVSSQSRKGSGRYTPTPAEWASLTIEPVTEHNFRAEHVTEGKIAVDEDRSTPVFSPYTGRVVRLLAKPGDSVTQGQPLFVIEAADTVQAQNDFITALTGVNKAKSALDLAQLQDTRAKDLFEGKAVPLKDYQQSQATLVQAQNDMRSSQTALEAARNKLANSRPEPGGDCGLSGQGPPRSLDHRLLADRGHRGAAEDRARAIHQLRRQRSRVCDR